MYGGERGPTTTVSRLAPITHRVTCVSLPPRPDNHRRRRHIIIITIVIVVVVVVVAVDVIYVRFIIYLHKTLCVPTIEWLLPFLWTGFYYGHTHTRARERAHIGGDKEEKTP